VHYAQQDGPEKPNNHGLYVATRAIAQSVEFPTCGFRIWASRGQELIELGKSCNNLTNRQSSEIVL
jgi:hypothetical protein